MRTVGAVGRQLQTLFNGGFELRLRLWSPPCAGYDYRVYTVANRVRVTVMIRVRVSGRVKVRVMLKDRGRARVRGLGSGTTLGGAVVELGVL